MPMEKVVTISMADSDKAYPYSVTQRVHVINDKIADVPVVVFHADGAVSALDKESIASSRKVGSTGVFDVIQLLILLHMLWAICPAQVNVSNCRKWELQSYDIIL